MIMRLSTVMLLVTLAGGLLVAPLAGNAQQAQKMPKIGVLLLGSPPSAPDWKQRSLFLQELRTLGWLEGQNMLVEYRWAHGRFDRLYDLAVELVRLNVDVIVASDTPAVQAAQQATPTIPIVMLYIGDPVADGIVTSLAQPGGNITGTGGLVPDLSGKMLELLTEAVPGVSQLAVLVNPAYPRTASMLSDVARAARAVDVQLHVVEVQRPEAFERAFATAVKEGAGALLILPAVLFAYNQRRLAALAVQNRLPAIFWQRPFAEAGGLMAYGPRLPDLWRRVAALVDRVLKGAKPADLPVEQPTRFELVINLKTAQALGMTIPPMVLFQADEVIR
jgi:putative ABC transport system substrate-binding protein